MHPRFVRSACTAIATLVALAALSASLPGSTLAWDTPGADPFGEQAIASGSFTAPTRFGTRTDSFVAPPVPPDAPWVPGELIVRFESGLTVSDEAGLLERMGVRRSERFGGDADYRLVELSKKTPVSKAVQLYGNQPGVALAQPNYVYTIEATPSDPRFGELWGLHNTGQEIQGDPGTADADIDAPEAWEYETGDGSVVVAVIDTGIDYGHTDLQANIWTNAGEIPGDGIDDDSNGYVDDVHGFDFYHADGDPYDDNGHGTHVAGTIGGVSDNGEGVAGVTWDVQLMGLRFLAANGSGTTADAVEAVRYAESMGADVINASWVGTGYDSALESAIADFSGVFVAAAGNEGSDNDSTEFYPCGYDLANVIAVSATDNDDALASFSNYGATEVDLAAPGVRILSTVPGSRVPIDGGTVFSDDFDDLSSWDTSDHVHQPWALESGAYVSPPTSAGLISYENTESAWMESVPPLDLSAAPDDVRATLRYRARVDVEYYYDMVYALARNPSETRGWMHTGDNEGWTEYSLDLEHLTGRTDGVIVFGLESDSSVASDHGYAGAYVDDVSVEYTVGDYTDAYAYFNGTSMATPHVAGAAALLLSRFPDLTATELKTALMDSVDPIPGLEGTSVTGGRLNVYAALLEADATAPIVTSDAKASYDDSATVALSATDDLEVSHIGWRLDGTDGDPFTSVDGASAVVSTSEVGSHTLRYWAEDVSGNRSATGTAAFEVLDVTAPTPHDDHVSVYEDSAAIDLWATDNDVVSRIGYRLDGAQGDPFTSVDGTSAVVSTSEVGSHTLHYWAEDVSGNRSATRTATFAVEDARDPYAWDDHAAVYSDVARVTIEATDSVALSHIAYRLDSEPTETVSVASGATTMSVEVFTSAIGTHTLAYHAEDGSGNRSATTEVVFEVEDVTAPTVADDAEATYTDSATIRLTATDNDAVDRILYRLDGGSWKTVTGDSATLLVETVAEHVLEYRAVDPSGNDSSVASVGFEIVRGPVDYVEVEGSTRYETAVESSKRGFSGGADTVVIATGANWPDALGGSALAGVVDGPLLLTDPSALPSGVATEIDRLGATKAYVLGGRGAVSDGVVDALEQRGLSVRRLAGADRYATAQRVAREVIDLQGASYDGKACIATGSDFPDALAGSPLAAAFGWPIVLADDGRALVLPAETDSVLVLGGEGAVSGSIEDEFVARLGRSDVVRRGGADRYETGVRVAEYGVAAGLVWSGVGIATGGDYPDALAGGAMLGSMGTVTLLTPGDALAPSVEAALSTNRDLVIRVHFLGGDGALSPAVRTQVRAVLE